MQKMKRTIAKMLHAQTSMTAAKLLSARRPLPRWLRKARMAEGAPLPGVGDISSAAIGGGVTGIGDGTGIDEPGSLSVVMRLGGTILFLSAEAGCSPRG